MSVILRFYFNCRGLNFEHFLILFQAVIWSRGHSQGAMWRTGHIELRNYRGAPFRIIFEGKASFSPLSSDIGLDDLKMSSEKCPRGRFCDFQDDFCRFTVCCLSRAPQEAVGWVSARYSAFVDDF